MNEGVNKYGVQWVKKGNTYYCYLTQGGLQLSKVFKNVRQSYIDRLDFYGMQN